MDEAKCENIVPTDIDVKEPAVISSSPVSAQSSPSVVYGTPIAPSTGGSPLHHGKSAVQLDSMTSKPVRPMGLLRTPSNRSDRASRSMTEAEIAAEIATPEEIIQLAKRLQTDEPPLSLDQVRKRRASIKEERKANINFIRARTNSRAAQMGRPQDDVAERLPDIVTEGVVLDQFEPSGPVSLEEKGDNDRQE